MTFFDKEFNDIELNKIGELREKVINNIKINNDILDKFTDMSKVIVR